MALRERYDRLVNNLFFRAKMGIYRLARYFGRGRNIGHGGSLYPIFRKARERGFDNLNVFCHSAACPLYKLP